MTDDTASDSEEEKKKKESESKGDNSKAEKLPNPLMEKLPHPVIGKKKTKKKKSKVVVEGSVFVNPFEKAEQAKQSILEKHVKMTENQPSTGKNVKICWKFKKGRCPFGKNCKYSHDVDSNLSLKYQNSEVAASESEQEGKNHHRKFPNLPPPPKPVGFMGTVGTLKNPRGSAQTSSKSYSTYRQQLHDKETEADDDNYMLSAKKKKRYGVAQNLVPPKKAMTALIKQRNEERPWTVQKNWFNPAFANSVDPPLVI